MLIWILSLGCSGAWGEGKVIDTGDTEETGDTQDAGDTGDSDVPTETPVGLKLNEFLASNDTVNADEAGEYDDWAELYNGGSETVSLAGLFLTDDLSEPDKWAFPGGDLAPGAYLLVWCDEGDGDYHTTFKLSADGGDVGLFFGDQELDSVTYEGQETDISTARIPNGTGDWTGGQTPTPGSSNG